MTDHFKVELMISIEHIKSRRDEAPVRYKSHIFDKICYAIHLQGTGNLLKERLKYWQINVINTDFIFARVYTSTQGFYACVRVCVFLPKAFPFPDITYYVILS